MKDTLKSSKPVRLVPARMLAMLVAALISVAGSGIAGADSPLTLGETLKIREAGGHQVGNEAIRDANAADPDTSPTLTAEEERAETWGIQITSIRLTANDHMIDYRYKVLDAAKAADLFKRQIKPAMIHQETGKVLAVPSTAKLGPLRNSDIPKEGKIYWMFFGNGGNLVKAGDKVTVVIGDFRVEDLVVE